MRIVLRKPRWLRRRSDDDFDELPPRSRRQRLIIAAAAIGITAAIGAAIMAPHLESMRAKQLAAHPKPCKQGQTRDCIGGTMNAVVVPPAASATPR